MTGGCGHMIAGTSPLYSTKCVRIRGCVPNSVLHQVVGFKIRSLLKSFPPSTYFNKLSDFD